MAFNGSGSPLTSLNASNLASGTVPTARMPTYVTSVNGQSGTVSLTLTPSTSDVLTATAGASAGDIGTYAWLGENVANTSTTFGGTRAGSNLRATGVNKGVYQYNVSSLRSTAYIASDFNTTPSGTWRCMGDSKYYTDVCGSGYYPSTLWLRIS